MRLLPDDRPSALAFACSLPTAVKARGAVAGLTAVSGYWHQGLTVSGFGLSARTIAKIDNYIGTSAKGAGTAPATTDQQVMVNEARGIPPRGRPV